MVINFIFRILRVEKKFVIVIVGDLSLSMKIEYVLIFLWLIILIKFLIF